MAHKIEHIWMFTVIDDNGDEGVPAFKHPITGTWTPLIASDEVRLGKLVNLAKLIAADNGIIMKLYKFSEREFVETIGGH